VVNWRDLPKGVDSPLPTQVVSNEEFIPRPQNQAQKRVEHRIGEMAAEKVEEAETMEPAAAEEKWPKSEYFILDVQAHFTNGFALNFRNSEFIRNMGFQLKNDAESYGFKNFLKEMFFDSETDMLIISGVPGRELLRDAEARHPRDAPAAAASCRAG
jgi:hypothetical protein